MKVHSRIAGRPVKLVTGLEAIMFDSRLGAAIRTPPKMGPVRGAASCYERYSVGDLPDQRRKACLKLFASLKPSDSAMSSTDILVVRR